VFARLAALLPQDAIWVTSHLSRTVQTAQAIQAAGHFTSPEIHQDKDFAEQHLGDWQGLDRRSFLLGRQQEPDSFWYAAADERAPNGESFVDVIERVGAGVARVNRTYSGKDIVAVAHGGTIRARSEGPGKGSEFEVRLPVGEVWNDAGIPGSNWAR